MPYDQLQKKLAETQLELNPAMQDVMQRVREVGLHKIATTLYDLDELSLPKIAQHLGTRLLLEHHKQEKIASGLNALRTLEASGDVKLASLLQIGKNTAKNLVPKAGKKVKKPSGFFEGAAQQKTVPTESPGLFSAFKSTKKPPSTEVPGYNLKLPTAK
jgi:hypothetical protein